MKMIGQASKMSGVGIEAIRYYEREGIVPEIRRAPNGRREYANEDISRLKFIKRFRSLGFPVADILSLQKLAFDKHNNCQEAAAIGERNLTVVREKIVELQQIEKALRDLVQHCSENPEVCPMLEDLPIDRELP